MTDKQKKALGYFITAGLFAIAGGVTLLAATPTWIPVLMNAAVMVAAGFGIYNVVQPEDV